MAKPVPPQWFTGKLKWTVESQLVIFSSHLSFFLMLTLRLPFCYVHQRLKEDIFHFSRQTSGRYLSHEMDRRRRRMK